MVDALPCQLRVQQLEVANVGLALQRILNGKISHKLLE